MPNAIECVLLGFCATIMLLSLHDRRGLMALAGGAIILIVIAWLGRVAGIWHRK